MPSEEVGCLSVDHSPMPAAGGAEVSPRHGNFLVNASGACSSADLARLMEHIRMKVMETSGIELGREICIVPYD